MALGGEHSPRVSRKREARIREILRRSLAIAAEEGVDALTIGRLASDLDYTPGALYRYFASKDAIVAELQRSVVVYLGRAIARLADRVREHADREGLDDEDCALAAVAAAALGFADFGRRSPAAFGFLAMYLSDPRYRLSIEDAAYVHSATRETLDVLARLFAAAERSGALGPGDEAARALTSWAALQGVMQTRKLARNDPDAVDVNALVRGLVRSLLVGWGAPSVRIDGLLARIHEEKLYRLDGSIEELFENTNTKDAE
jgi:AcrR family transcriptional regulator